MVGSPVNPETVPEDGSFFRHWVCGTFFGWLAGLAIIIAGAVVGDLVGTGEADYQFIVGLGMGVGVGYAQGRVLKRWFGTGGGWMWASVIGFGLPFVLFDLVGTIWRRLPDLPQLELEVVISALLAGVLQRRILSAHSSKTDWWIPASIAGWALAAATAASGSFLEIAFLGRWLNVATILLGGLVLGVVTGGFLVRIRRGPIRN